MDSAQKARTGAKVSWESAHMVNYDTLAIS